MNRSREVEAKVGIFVSLGIVLIMATILLVGGGNAIFQRNLHFTTTFPQIEGLVEGAMVRIGGVKVGQVQKITLLKDSGQVQVGFTVAGKFSDNVKEDSVVGIRTLGVLGDKYLVVGTGTLTGPPAKEGIELKSETPKEFRDYLSSADVIMDRVKSSLENMTDILESFRKENRADTFFKNIAIIAQNAGSSSSSFKPGLEHLNSIVTKIDTGKGTLGALVNDATLYDDLKAILGGANRNRVLKYFIKKSVEESRDAATQEKK